MFISENFLKIRREGDSMNKPILMWSNIIILILFITSFVMALFIFDKNLFASSSSYKITILNLYGSLILLSLLFILNIYLISADKMLPWGHLGSKRVSPPNFSISLGILALIYPILFMIRANYLNDLIIIFFCVICICGIIAIAGGLISHKKD